MPVPLETLILIWFEISRGILFSLVQLSAYFCREDSFVGVGKVSYDLYPKELNASCMFQVTQKICVMDKTIAKVINQQSAIG